MTQSICGNFLPDKRSMVAFTWTLTTVMTLFAFLTAISFIIQTHTHYNRIERYYDNDDWYQEYLQEYQENQEDQENEDEHRSSQDQALVEQYQAQAESYRLMATLSARSLTFASVLTMLLAVGLSLYGSMGIVGFMSLRGVYIAPCFSSDQDTLKIGIFGGAIVVFANLLLVCAVVLGEIRVHSYGEERQDDQRDEYNADLEEPYQVERIATILAVTCMFLSALYTIFAILLFLCYAGDYETAMAGVGSMLDDPNVSNIGHPRGRSHVKTPSGLVTMSTHGGLDSRLANPLDSHGNPGFITMEDST